MSLPLQVQVVHNQPYDESLEVSDGEEVASNNPSPRLPPDSEQHSKTHN